MARGTGTSVGTIKALAWSGGLLVLALLVSYAIMGFLPPPAPALSAAEIKGIFVERTTAIRIGTAIESIGFTFYLTWACSVVMIMRRMERGTPILSLTSLANAGGGYVLFLLMPFIWATLAYRAPLLEPWFVQFMNDFA